MMQFDVRSGAMALGLMFFALALFVWATLHQRADRRAVNLWFAGALVGAVALIGFALRSPTHQWLGYELTYLALVLSPVLRVMALRQHLQQPLRPWQHLAVVVIAVALFSTLHRLDALEARVAYAGGTTALATGYLTLWAWRAARITRSRSARVMTWAELLGALGVALGVLMQLFLQPGAEPPATTPRNVLWLVSLSVAALYGALGYVGMVLDGLQSRAIANAQRATLAADREAEAIEQRELAERHARQLEELLQEQARLTAEREQLLHVMAHEIRQPLHNASGVLQALRLLEGNGPPPPVDLAQRAARADAVLGQVRDVLDNVLAAAVLLNRREPLRLQKTDLGFLIEMALLDLPESQRPRVRLEGLDELGPVLLEPHLLRLTLRNLLRNAFVHAGPDVQVQVSARRLRQGGGLRVTVSDDGSSLDTVRLVALQRIASSDTPPDLVPQAGAKRGLGLKIVRHVMALHGGRVDIAARPSGGLAVGLEFPPPEA